MDEVNKAPMIENFENASNLKIKSTPINKKGMHTAHKLSRKARSSLNNQFAHTDSYKSITYHSPKITLVPVSTPKFSPNGQMQHAKSNLNVNYEVISFFTLAFC